jgi:flavin-dependent dehydrogenase
MTTIRADVAVAGGGPAGSALARRLAILGYDVVLIERNPSARSGVAESLETRSLERRDRAH